MTAGDISNKQFGSFAGGRIWCGTVETNGTSGVAVATGFTRILGVWLTFAEAPSAGTTSLLYVSAVSGGTVTIVSSAASGAKDAYVLIFGI
jgi:hypothetical protein